MRLEAEAQFPIPDTPDDAVRAARDEIKARGPVDVDATFPQEPWVIFTRESQRKWLYTYIKTGGDRDQAIKAAGLTMPARQAEWQYFRNGKDLSPSTRAMRAALVLLNGYFREAWAKANDTQSFALVADLEPISRVPVPVVVPEIVPAPEEAPAIVNLDRRAKTAAALEIFDRAMGASPGDFIKHDHVNGRWQWDMEKIKAAPPGVVKSLKVDTKGETQVEFHSALDAARFVSEHFKVTEDHGRSDTRAVVVAVLQQADPSQRLKLEDLAREAARLMRAGREEKNPV